MLVVGDNDVAGAVTTLRRILEPPEGPSWLDLVGITTSLPVVTIADPRRIIRDAEYAKSAALRRLDFLDRIESLRGTGRLFVP